MNFLLLLLIMLLASEKKSRSGAQQITSIPIRLITSYSITIGRIINYYVALDSCPYRGVEIGNLHGSYVMVRAKIHTKLTARKKETTPKIFQLSQMKN